MGNWRDSIPSKWLKAADLEGRPHLVTIKKFTVEVLDGVKKPAVWFAEEPKALILNITNGKKIETICGSGDPISWPGNQVVIFPTETELRGETVDCIRVRAPKPGAAKKRSAPQPPKEEEPEESAEFQADDDDVPF